MLLLDRAGRIKPCGGAIPPRLIKDFDIPDELLVARITSARMISPADVKVDIPIEGGFVGMVDREHFDEWLRERAADAGAVRCTGTFERIERDRRRHQRRALSRARRRDAAGACGVGARRCVIGADGARSEVARQTVPGAEKTSTSSRTTRSCARRRPARRATTARAATCYYRGELSPDFYGWVFPHGDTMSVGTGSADKGFSLRTGDGGAAPAPAGWLGCETVRREGAPIPLKPLPRWDNGRDVVLAGDAAGVVAPASGEGIYYAMVGGRVAAEAAHEFLATGDARALAGARKRFMKAHGRVFWVLGIMQRFWYSTDKRRERFVSICQDQDVQTLTFEAYMNKELVREKPMAHVRIFFKDLAHLLGLARV